MVDALVGNPANPHLLARLADDTLHAPALLDFEVTSALRGHLLGGKLDEERLDAAIEDFVAFRIERYPSTFAVMRRRGPRLAGLPGFLRLWLVGGMWGEIVRR